MLREILAFEWRHHARQPAFYAAAALFALLGFALGATSFGPDNVAVNSSYLVTEMFGFLSLFALFAVAVFASNAVLRDDEYRMREIVDATPVARFPFLLGRFAGVFLATLTVVSLSAIGNLAATFMPWLDPKRVAAFDLRPYLAAFTTITIPNVLFATALLFAIAVRTRNSIATYAASVIAYILYLVSSALTNSPLMAASKAGGGGGTIPALLDPFGLTAFFDVTRDWTAAAKNTLFVPMTGTLLANRAICVFIAIALWGYVWARHRRGAGLRPAVAPASLPAPRAGRARDGRLAAGPTSMQLRALFNKTTLLLLLAWLVLVATELYSAVLDGEYGSKLYPATGLIVETIQQPLWLIGTILILYFGAELFWREQRYRFASIVDSTPISGAVMIAAKLAALGALIAALIVSAIATGVALQLSRGWTQFDPLVYLSLVYFVGLPLLLIAAASFLIHALSPGKYAGMIFTLVFVIFVRRAPAIGLDSPLWRYASAPPVTFSEMNRFGHQPAMFSMFMLHWSAYAAIFVILAAMLWRRFAAPLSERLRVLRRPHRATITLVLVILASGVFIAARTESEDLNDWKAGYERTYKRIDALPEPDITAVDANVDLDPQQRTFHVDARYALVNATAHPIDTLYVAVRREANLKSIALDRAKLTSSDTRFGMHRFTFQPPLAPGARTTLHFDFTVQEQYDDNRVVGNGSLLISALTFPSLGYRDSYEIADPNEREKRGLPLRGEKDTGDIDLGDDHDQWIDFRATVTTSADQIALAPGRLEASGVRNGRRWFRYHTDTPIPNRFGFVSARYAVAKRQVGAIAVELYYDPAHAMNVPRMLDSAAASLEVLQSSFGAYPGHDLRIAEVPTYWQFGGYALPQLVLLGEDRAFLTDSRGDQRVDLIARRVAHEIAHQWFGHRFIATNGPGGLVVTESLAKYGELLTLERMVGRERVRPLLEFELDRYLTGRTRETRAEVPLARVEGQPYLYYAKGAVVLWAIRDLLGAEAMDRALRAAMQAPHPSGSDIARELRRIGNPLAGPLIDQWMNDIVLYDLRLESATSQRRADGRWDVLLRVNAAKKRADGAGNETSLPLEESIEIAVDERSQKYELRSGMNELHVTVDKEPSTAVIDPWVTRIDRNPQDNAKAVERVSGDRT